MKINLTGTQGVGKTTVLNELSHIYPQFNIITEVVRDLSGTGVKINEEGDNKSQYTIFNTYQKLFEQNKNYISDRGLVDVVAYDRYLYKHNKINQIVLLNHQQMLKKFLKFNPGVLHVYFPIEFDLVDDGVRSANKEFQKEIDTHIANILHEYDIVHIKVSGSVEERVKQIKKHINNMTKTNSVKFNEDVKLTDLKPSYDESFDPTQEYLDSMPDIQNGEFSDIPINFVGIQDFKLPLRIRTKEGNIQDVTANITGTVSLEAEKRGINMSRIIRTFYKSKEDVFTINKLEEVLRSYKKDLESFDAHILMNFEYHIWQDALRSKKEDGTLEGGYQFYNVTFDVNIDKSGEFKKVLWVDFIYSSACPCSTELVNHASLTRGVFGIPHSQRSVARLGMEFNNILWIEDVVEACKEALTTETLVFCKRQDEQAFGEKNGNQPKFVEDAIRLLAHQLNGMELVKDYKVICSHQESLHNHNAVAVATKGLKNSIFNHHVSLGEWKSLQV